MSFNPVQPAASTAPRPRHALGLPAGSVRAILTLLVVGLFCALVLIPPKEGAPPPRIPAYLFFLLFLTLGHFFAAHGHTIHQRGEGGYSPLYLPSGVIRFLILAGLIATVVWARIDHPDRFAQQLRESLIAQPGGDGGDLPYQIYLPLMLLGGFFVGVIVRTLVGRHSQAYWWQDIEAWFALIGAIGLFIEVLIHLVINPTLEHPLELPNWEGFLTAIVAFYFGARS